MNTKLVETQRAMIDFMTQRMLDTELSNDISKRAYDLCCVNDNVYDFILIGVPYDTHPAELQYIADCWTEYVVGDLNRKISEFPIVLPDIE